MAHPEIADLDRTCEACPHCGCEKIRVEHFAIVKGGSEIHHFARCLRCFAQGPILPSQTHAKEAWDRRELPDSKRPTKPAPGPVLALGPH